MNRDMALKMESGMKVMTDFSGKWTEHTIIGTESRAISQTGVLFIVKPIVQKSGGGAIDAGWFHLLPERAE